MPGAAGGEDSEREKKTLESGPLKVWEFGGMGKNGGWGNPTGEGRVTMGGIVERRDGVGWGDWGESGFGCGELGVSVGFSIHLCECRTDQCLEECLKNEQSQPTYTKQRERARHRAKSSTRISSFHLHDNP